MNKLKMKIITCIYNSFSEKKKKQHFARLLSQLDGIV